MNDEDGLCIEIDRRKVCVVTDQDMGKKRIVVVEPDEKEKWFEKIEEMSDYLKSDGVSNRKRIDAMRFVSSQFRSLKRLGNSFGVDAQGFGVGLGVKRDEDKEV